MPNLNDVERFLGSEAGLATISTTQGDGRVLSSIANCGIIPHPVSREPTVALVSAGGAARLDHIRRGSQVTIAIRRGWSWVAVTGPADLIGPDDPIDGVESDEFRLLLRLLLREIFLAAGGTHEDFGAFDDEMAAQARTAVVVTPERILGNGAGA